MNKQNTEDIFYGKEPTWKNWTPDDFKDIEKVAWSIAMSANWYNIRYTERDYRNAVLEYAEKMKIQDWQYMKKLGTDVFAFRSIGGKCKAATKGCVLPPMFQKNVDDTITQLIEMGKRVSSAEPQEEVVSVRDRVKNQSCMLASELEEQIDDYLQYIVGNNPHYKKFEMEDWLRSAQPSAMHCQFMLESFQPRVEELNMALLGENKELREGYSHITKAQLRKLYDFHKMLCDYLKLHIGIVKSNRKPRKKKKKKPDQVVKKLKYLLKDTKTGAESILPESIVGGSTVIVYNTKTGKGTMYYADSTSGGISVKGTTLVGFDKTLSKEKKIKKPAEFIKCAKKDGIRAINNHWKSINTKETEPNGRINANTLLLRSIK